MFHTMVYIVLYLLLIMYYLKCEYFEQCSGLQQVFTRKYTADYQQNYCL